MIDFLAQDIHLALQNAFPEDEMTVRPGIAFYFDARDILCIRCKVRSLFQLKSLMDFMSVFKHLTITFA